mgnify:CR=1 FL=1
MISPLSVAYIAERQASADEERGRLEALVRSRLSTNVHPALLCRASSSDTMSARLWLCFSVYESRFRHTSAIISSLYIALTLRKKLHRRTDFWAGISRIGADGPYEWFRSRVVDVPKIPSEEIVNAMERCNRNMQCVGLCASGDTTFGYKLFGRVRPRRDVASRSML